ncbi:metallophosphoesterase [Haliangium sp.]|uniref:metallophosphoesterase n=1 Tax=Haliangium sp. TaxID=2663208 RepID=UPI003D0B1FCB
MARVLRLPDHGRLIVCTDLQGCLQDYDRIVEIFEQAREESGGHAHVLFTGDLVHGPHLEVDEWPDFLGEYYRDQSGEVVEAFAALRDTYPGHVHALLGNHEHGHIGGPHTAKFAYDEVELLESRLGPARTLHLRQVLRSLPLVALAPCGAVFTHGAPAATIDSLAEIEAADLDAYGEDSPLDILAVPVIGPILWARSASPEAARRFLGAVGGSISIFGHDVIPRGFERIGDEQIVVSTSFGVFDANKVYLDLDLGGHYRTVHELRVGHEILPLYPDKAHHRRG